MSIFASKEKKAALSVEGRVALRMLNDEYFAIKDLFLRPELLENAAKLLDKARRTVLNGKTKYLTVTEMLNLASKELNLNTQNFVDRIFVLNLVTVSNDQVYLRNATDAIKEWVSYYHAGEYSKGKNPLGGDSVVLKKFCDRYALLTIGRDKKEKIEETAGITWFLRYPPQMLEDTYKFFSDNIHYGQVTLFLGPDTDHNGAFYSYFSQFRELRSRTNMYFIAMEASNEEEFVRRMEHARKIGWGSNLKRKTFIIAGHGTPDSIQLGRGRDEKNFINISDKEKGLFSWLKHIFWSEHSRFEWGIVIACSAGKRFTDRNGNDVDPVVQHLAGTFSDNIQALEIDGLPRLAKH